MVIYSLLEQDPLYISIFLSEDPPCGLSHTSLILTTFGTRTHMETPPTYKTAYKKTLKKIIKEQTLAQALLYAADKPNTKEENLLPVILWGTVAVQETKADNIQGR